MDDRYRVIEVEANKTEYDKIIGALAALSHRFPKKDAYFEYKDSKIFAYLKAVDVREMRNYIESLSSEYGIADIDNPFLQVMEQIERIGSYGIKGRKRVFAGYNEERKVVGRLDRVRKRGTYYYAKDHTCEHGNNELPEQFANRILCDDSDKVLKELPDNCIDLVLTSPPYNFGLGYDTEEDGIDWDKYFHKLFSVFGECIRVLKHGGRIAINIQPLFSDYIPSHHIISEFFMRHKLIWKGEILWEKHNYNCKYTAWGSWKSPSNPYLKYTWEFLEIFAKGTLTKKGRREDIDISGEEFKRWVTAKWSIAPEREMGKYGHPAMFPEELVARVLKLFSYRGDTVLDPFIGVGTTALVAKKLGRKYLGIDISEDYCRKATERVNSALI